MHIRELQLIGFKSFQGKTRLCLSSGMNAVIGPNGCGKTNILDALRWVLGEQSFSLLRCARNEDLIFSGTDRVPPTNYADVRLVLANDELPQYGSEIEIRRRYFRSGESEYFLNRQTCRLKDVQEVFLASGIGTKAYSIFDLRQMREIIAGHIRRMFDEAASLAKYQEAKEDCQRKLGLTEADLTRLDDIIAERDRVVRSLGRQAGKLRSYDRLKEEEKGLRLLELKSDFESISRELKRAKEDASALEQAEAHGVTGIRQLEQELQEQRGKLRQEQSVKDELVGRMRKRQQELTGLESQDLLGRQKIQFLKDRANQADKERKELEGSVAALEQMFNQALSSLSRASSREQELQKELELAQEQARSSERKLYELRSHEQTTREGFQDLLERRHEAQRKVAHLEAVEQNQAEAAERVKGEIEELKQRLGQVQAGLAEVEQSVAEKGSSIGNERNRLDGLETELTRLEDERKQVHQQLSKAREKRNRLEKELAVLRSVAPDRLGECRKVLGKMVLGEVSKLLTVEQGWEKACEAALQPVVDFLVFDGEPRLEQLARLAREGPEAGCGLLGKGSEKGFKGSRVQGVEGSSLPDDEAVIGRLGDYVKVKETMPEVVRNLVGSFLVVRDRAEIEKLAKKYPGWPFVTEQGCARFADGRFVVAGRGSGRLLLSRRAKQKSDNLEETVEHLTRLEAQERELEKQLAELDATIEGSKENLAQLERRKSSLDAKQEALAAKKAELERDEERLRADLGRVAADRRAKGKSLSSTGQELQALSDQVEHQAGNLKQVEQQVAEQEQEVKAGLDKAGQHLAGLSEQRQKVSRLDSEINYSKRTIQEHKRRMNELEQTAVRAREEASELGKETAARAPGAQEIRKQIAELEAKIDKLRVADLRTVEEELEKNLDELRHTREQNQQILLKQRLEQHELKARQTVITQEAVSVYGTDIARFEPEETTDVAERLAKVRSRLEVLGTVNPLAREEFAREKQDLERLRTQRADVAAARENLLQTMAEIDRHARERFLATYQKVRSSFKEVFRQLFLEGDADLILVDEDNPLDSEVAIIARPRGKNPKRLDQLSDGEKALLALSLLFAFYRVKPAPFCFLDEVDAPLDDANVGRFADYLKSISRTTQVVVITHNRLTVERAGALFGVTAEQPGVSQLVSLSLADYQSSPVASSVS